MSIDVSSAVIMAAVLIDIPIIGFMVVVGLWLKDIHDVLKAR